jgi:hypothetical protein
MRKGRERWRGLVAQWRSSGQTARDFADGHGVNVSTLSHWAWRLRRESRDGTAIARVPPMIEVRARSAADDRFEIELGSRRVRIPPSFDADALRRLIAALEEAS